MHRLLLILFAAILSGCVAIPVGETTVNNKLFTSPDDLTHRVELLVKEDHLSEAAVFSSLGITPKTPNLKRLSASEIWSALYGGSLGLNEDQRVKMSEMSGWEVPFVWKKRSAMLQKFFHVEYEETGHEMSVVLIFSNGVLYEKRLLGIAVVDRKEKKILVNPFEQGLRIWK